jgi:hypothetical protein
MKRLEVEGWFGMVQVALCNRKSTVKCTAYGIKFGNQSYREVKIIGKTEADLLSDEYV